MRKNESELQAFIKKLMKKDVKPNTFKMPPPPKKKGKKK